MHNLDRPPSSKEQHIAFFGVAAATCRRLASVAGDENLADVLLEMASEYEAAGKALALLAKPCPANDGLSHRCTS